MKPFDGGVSLRLACAALSGVLVTVTLPSADLGFLAWIALVPLVHACRSAGFWRAALYGYIAGFVAAVGVFWWMLELPHIRWWQFVFLGGIVAFYTAAWSVSLAPLVRSRVPFVLGAPAAWVLLDWVRAHAGFLSLPWGSLAQTQHADLPLLQLARFTGEYGVSFFVVMANVVIAQTVTDRRWQRVAAVAAVLAVTHAIGMWMLGSAAPAPSLKVAVIQPAILNTLEHDPHTGEKRLAMLMKMSASLREKPDLLVWPETSVAMPPRGPDVTPQLQAYVNTLGYPLVTGVAQVAKFSKQTEVDGAPQFETKRVLFNSAYQFVPGAETPAIYHKNRLVPFAEYTPLKDRVTWPRWLVPKMGENSLGDDRNNFILADGRQYGVTICWESIFPELTRASVRDGAAFMVQLTNDNWFGPTAQPLQHNLASQLRAVENGVPVILASNTGPSEIIDAKGRVMAVAGTLFEPAVIEAAIAPVSGGTFYTRHGDVFAAVMLAVWLLALLSAFPFASRASRLLVKDAQTA